MLLGIDTGGTYCDAVLYDRTAGVRAAAKALTTKARFRFRADLEDWDYAFHKDVPKAKIAELAQLSFFHNRESLILNGKTGVGKTHLAIALGKRLCHEGHATVFLSVNFRFEKI